MRIGIAVPVGAESAHQHVRAAVDAEELGLDLVWLESDAARVPAAADALTAAAYVAAQTSAIRIAVKAPLSAHPVLIAEQAAVADNASLGRVVLALSAFEPSCGVAPAALLQEGAALILAATGPRPFRHEGARWTVPAGLDGNDGERRISVTPNPAQLELPIWLAGPSSAAVGRRMGLSHVSQAGDDPGDVAAEWSLTERELGPIAARMRRPAIRRLECSDVGDFDDEALTRSLLSETEQWGMDVVLLELPAAFDNAAWRRALHRVAGRVRPYLQIDRVPVHLERYWRQRLGASSSE